MYGHGLSLTCTDHSGFHHEDWAPISSGFCWGAGGSSRAQRSGPDRKRPWPPLASVEKKEANIPGSFVKTDSLVYIGHVCVLRKLLSLSTFTFEKTTFTSNVKLNWLALYIIYYICYIYISIFSTVGELYLLWSFVHIAKRKSAVLWTNDLTGLCRHANISTFSITNLLALPSALRRHLYTTLLKRLLNNEYCT